MHLMRSYGLLLKCCLLFVQEIRPRHTNLIILLRVVHFNFVAYFNISSSLIA